MGTKAFHARQPHHDGIRPLWDSKWKYPCSKGLYPFHDGAFEDFEPVFQNLIKNNINDGTCIEYTQAFMPSAAQLVALADSICQTDPSTASSLYLRACALYRIARFPYITAFPTINCPIKWQAWEAQKEAYARAGATWTATGPLEQVVIPHVHARGADRPDIPVYVRVPAAAAASGAPVPVVVLMTGLDGYRPDNTARCDEFLARGWAALVVEIPGTADCPADPADPLSPDRLWSSVLDWVAAEPRLDARRVLVWGLSSGGYYAVRVAHTHADRLVGSVAQGAGCHLFFDAAWLARADGHEYPFQLTPALAMKHGFGEDVDAYLREARGKFSLLEDGTLERRSCRLLFVNGMLDGLMPVEDSLIPLEHGTPKEVRLFPGALHMGYPAANDAVYPWMESVLASATIPT